MTDNQIRAAFGAVRADEDTKRAVLGAVEARRAGSAPRRTAWARPIAALCAALVLAVGLGGWAAAAPVAYVSIDVNPSLELTLNRFDRIVDARAYGGDGEGVLAGLSLRGKTCAQGVELVLGSAAMAPYLTDAAALTFTVAAPTPEKEAALCAAIEGCAGYGQYGGQCAGAGLDTLSQAHGCGMSFGKYAAYQALAALDGTVTPEDCAEMTMGELYERMEECGGGHHYGGESSAPGTGSGNGYQGGASESASPGHHGNGGSSGGHHGEHG